MLAPRAVRYNILMYVCMYVLKEVANTVVEIASMLESAQA